MAQPHFTGKLAVVEAYSSYGVDTWGIAHGRDLLAVGSGDSELCDWLERLSVHETGIQYTLRVYRDKSPEEVRQNTPYDYSFRFYMSESYTGNSGMGKVMEKIAAIEKKIDGGDSDSDDFDLNKIVMGWLSDPNKLATVIGAVKSLVSPGAATMPALPMAAVSGVTEPEAEGLTETQMRKLERISGVLDRLERKDPQILEHLEKLDKIATEKPDTFKFLITNLNGL